MVQRLLWKEHLLNEYWDLRRYEWNGYYKGAWHIYGHIHSRMNGSAQYMLGQQRALNAGCMLNGYQPVSFRELVENQRIFREYQKNS